MKQLVCEMCGSNDIVKQDGYFVCQMCGTKYSVEEAKKIMNEGTVDVSGSTIKVDSSEELKNLYEVARRAKESENAENAAKYYDMILVKDPMSWEAAFYTVYYKAINCNIAGIESAAYSISNCEKSVLSLIHDQLTDDEQKEAVLEVSTRSVMAASLLAIGAQNHYNGIAYDIRSNYNTELRNRKNAAAQIIEKCADGIVSVFPSNEEMKRQATDLLEQAVEFCEKHECSYSYKKSLLDKTEKNDSRYTKYINERDNLLSQMPSRSGCGVGILRFLGIVIAIAGVIMAVWGIVDIYWMGCGVLIGGLVVVVVGIVMIVAANKMIKIDAETAAEINRKLSELDKKYKS